MRKTYIPNFLPFVPFLHVKKFVVGGGGGWVLKVDFSVKLDKKILAQNTGNFQRTHLFFFNFWVG